MNLFKKNEKELDQLKKYNKMLNSLYDEQENQKGKFDPRKHITKKLAAVELVKFLEQNKILSIINLASVLLVYGAASLSSKAGFVFAGIVLSIDMWFLFKANKQILQYKQKYEL